MSNRRKEFTKTQINRIFRKCEAVKDLDKTIWRHDRNGKLINLAAFGYETSEYGWNIHHINQDAKVTTINEPFDNLEAVHFETHKEIHADPEELNRKRAVEYILKKDEIPASGLILPERITLDGLEGPYLEASEIAQLLMDHIKKGRK